MSGDLRMGLYCEDGEVLRVILHDAPICTKSIN